MAIVFGILFIIGCFIVIRIYAVRFKNGNFISANEERIRFFISAYRDFVGHPIFGIGLGNQFHAPLFAGVPGSMVFYHNYIAQIAGSMGIVGFVAYFILVRDRIKLLFSNTSPFVEALRICYFGILAISMTNPGEFCPFPYEFIVVLILTIVESENEKNINKRRN